MKYSSICEIGDRDVNEDSVVCLERGDRWCFVVADGLGGHDKGEVASSIVTATFSDRFPESNESNAGFLAGAFNAAQERIIYARQKAAEMKTTCVALSIAAGRFVYGHVGDSRLYHFRRAKLRSRTLDHSIPQMLELSGEISEDDIRRHPDRGRLFRVMGDEWDFPRYELSRERKLSGGDAFLLCTDGFWEHIPAAVMAQALREAGSAEKWLRVMRDIVLSAGGEMSLDNFSAITVIIKE